jgi:MCM AAA-lid domain/MCM P-loop domain
MRGAVSEPILLSGCILFAHTCSSFQTLSVAKAGIVCKLNCRATIIAVMNPRDCLYDNQASLSVNTGLGTPLLSRFDIIFKLVDSSDIEREHNVTTYLLNRAIHGAGLDVVSNNDDGEEQQEKEPWSMEKLRAYISVVKENFQPAMSDSAALLLERHYEKCRSSQSNTIPITVRFLESLIRLSQAHARLMYRNTVMLQDAVAVIRIMECTAYTYGGYEGNVNDNENIMYCDPISIDFSPKADLDFVCFEYRLLKRYGMLHHMRDHDHKKALAELNADNCPSNGTGGNSSWQLMEHPRDSGNGTGNFGWGLEPGPAVGDALFTQQDHYGRVHVSRVDPKDVRGGGWS